MQRCDTLSAGGSFNGITANSNQTKTESLGSSALNLLSKDSVREYRLLVRGEEQKEIHCRSNRGNMKMAKCAS